MSITFPLKVFSTDRITVWHGTTNRSEIQTNELIQTSTIYPEK